MRWGTEDGQSNSQADPDGPKQWTEETPHPEPPRECLRLRLRVGRVPREVLRGRDSLGSVEWVQREIVGVRFGGVGWWFV